MLELRKIKRENNKLVFTWNDGKVTFISQRDLREKCPCANCQGETILFKRYEAPKRIPTDSPNAFEVKSIELVGSYAVQPVWKDGHKTGLFSLEYLQSITNEESS